MSEWGQSRSNWKKAYPIGNSAEKFIFENPDYAIYLRLRDEDKCAKHWSDSDASTTIARVTEEACSKCWGTGRLVTPKIIPIRLAQGLASTQGEVRSEAGYLEVWSYTGYIPRVIKPELEDIILICEWNIPIEQVPVNPKRKVLRFTDALTIKSVVDRFEREVAYIGINLKNTNIDKNLLDKNIPLTIDTPIFKEEEWSRTTYW
jgi:hypothetical protein